MSLSKRAAEAGRSARRTELPAVIVNPTYSEIYDYSPSPFRLWAPLAVWRSSRGLQRHRRGRFPGASGRWIVERSECATRWWEET